MIDLKLDPVEAHIALQAIQIRQLTLSKRAAKGSETADVSVRVLARVATMIVDGLMPTCAAVYADGLACEDPAVRNGYCDTHDRMTA